MKQLLVVVLVALAVQVQAQTDSKLGKASPELEFSSILNYSKSEASLSDFKSKIVLIDFWATSCSACIKSFPHLEELQRKFPEDLQIITVTDEPAEKLKQFLARRPTTLAIAFDPNKELAAHYPHRVIPHTVLIDKQGIVRAIASPAEINEATIQKLLANEPLTIPEKREIMNVDFSKPLSGNGQVTFQLTVLPYQNGLGNRLNTTGGTGEYANRRILAINLSPNLLYEAAYQFPSDTRTEIRVKDPAAFEREQSWICLDLIVPANKGAERFNIMKQQLDMVLEYKASIEEKLKPVKVLRVIKGKKENLPLSKGDEEDYIHNGGGLSMTNSPSGVIAEFLEGQLQTIVLDETGLGGAYDLTLPWYNEKPELIHQELKKLGLELVDAQRKVKILVIADK